MRKILIILCLFCFAAGCSGGGGPAGVTPPGPEPTPEPSPTSLPPTPPPGPSSPPEPSEPSPPAPAPTVTSTDPLRDAVGIETNVEIRIVFDRDIAAASVTQESAVVNCAGARIAGEVFAYPDNRGVGFRPGERLPLLSRCNVTVADISDAEERPMSAPYEFGFDTRNGEWRNAARVSDEVVMFSVSRYDNFSVVSKENGDAVFAWKTNGNEIKLTRYAALEGSPEAAVTAGQGVTGLNETPYVATNDGDGAVVVWSALRADGSHEVMARRYSFAQREFLSAAEGVSQPSAGVLCETLMPKAVMDRTGNVFVAWSQCLGGRAGSEIKVVRFDNSSGSWSAPSRASWSGRSVGELDIGVDSAGNALVVWLQIDPSPVVGVPPSLNVWSKRYNASESRWEVFQNLSNSELSGNLRFVRIAVSAVGDAVATWNQFDGTRFSVFARRYASASNAWALVEILSDDRWSAFDPSIAIDPSGNSVLAWQQYVAGNQRHIYTRRYIASEGAWRGFEDIAAQGDLPKIAMDNTDSEFVVWGREVFRADYELLTASYSAQNPRWVGNDVRGEISFNPLIGGGLEKPKYQIVMSGNGIVTLVWENFNMSPPRNELWMRRFD